MTSRFRGELEAWACARHTGACGLCDRAITPAISDDGRLQLHIAMTELCQDGRTLVEACTKEPSN